MRVGRRRREAPTTPALLLLASRLVRRSSAAPGPPPDQDLDADAAVRAASAPRLLEAPSLHGIESMLEEVDADTANQPGFIKAVYLITWAWNAAFVLMIIGNVLTIYVPGLPLWSSLVIAFAARNSAAYFTTWYPQYRKAKHATPPANALPGTH